MIGLINSKILRRIILLLTDTFLICLSIFFAYLFIDNAYLIKTNYAFIYYYSILVGISLYIFTGQYKAITRYLGSRIIYPITLRNLVLTIIIFILTNKIQQTNFSFNFWFLFFLFLCVTTCGIRFLARDLIEYYGNKKFSIAQKSNIVIYGAGKYGSTLSRFIANNESLNLIGFIDDDKNLQNRYLNGYKIYAPSIIENNNINLKKILIGIENIKKDKLKYLVEKIRKNGLEVFKSPGIEKLNENNFLQDQLRPISFSDLLGRETVKADNEILKACIENNNICITGAAGSIGGEICRQALKLKASKIILIDHSETNLYIINKELEENYESEIIPILSNLSNKKFLIDTLKKYEINTIFHCAAYKHVPLFESNRLNGLSNNIFSTLNLCEAAEKAKINNFMLISSDKAVRPTNIMGASKRICEIIVKFFADKNKNTIFSTVRFGNVIGSSGSVVPLFKEQIKKGGPVTITDKRMVRYFMSIEEAAQLVIQATQFSKGGEIFLLDMGKKVRIIDLVNQMISLSGLTVKDKKNKNGDIEIKEIGLRSGEKMYEELLVDAKAIKTNHPLIYKAFDKFIKPNNLLDILKNLDKLIESNKTEQAILIMKSLVPEYKKLD